MTEKSNNWTREQLLIAFNLYCQLPFGKFHSRHPEIIAFASLIGRTPSALAMKLVNIASLDPVITDSGRSGLTGASKLDRAMWEEMQADWNRFAVTSQTAVDALLALNRVNVEDADIEDEAAISDVQIDYSSDSKRIESEVRIGQHFFRRAVLSAYASRCCITGLAHPSLLVASHIIPWRSDRANRLNPSNGLCLSMLHDKAFDKGLLTVDTEYKIKISPAANKLADNPFASEWILGLDGKQIAMPEKFSPSMEFLVWHNKHVFQHN
ncbi:HNH endonuclease [Undibacterium sp. TC9W]|uniref:HNH endonuclease n=1 Tax=Undibacterium sp. TC9W TaxID=3413053 RepID=UPI003BF23BE4